MADFRSVPAAVAARAANAGGPAALFTVTHYGPTSGTPPTGATPPTDPDQVAAETLAVHLAGAGFHIHTRAPNRQATRPGTVTNAPLNDPGSAGHLFEGSVVINPEVRNDPATGTEVLLTIRHDPWLPDFADTLMIAHAYHRMVAAAASGGGPVLYVHSPAAPFQDPPPRYRADGSGEAPRISNGVVLRMLVGLDGHDTDTRLTLVRDIASLATNIGFGLQVSDHRFGRVRGQWWRLFQPDERQYTRRKAELFGWAPAGVPKAVRLVTVVGPARVGASAAIAAELVARNVGILAVSDALLGETAFVNLMIPIAPARISNQPASAHCAPVTPGLGRLASDCGLTRRRAVRARSRIGDSAAADYQVLSSGPVHPTMAEMAEAAEVPVWLSWKLPLDPDTGRAPRDVAELVAEQLRQATDRVTDSRIDYYRAKVHDDRIRGRAKLSLSLHQVKRQHIVPLLSELCPWAQREVEAALIQEGIPMHAIQLRVAWRERWLNRRNLVM